MTTVELRDGSGLANVGQPDNTMRERKEPTFVQFGLGEMVEGVLMGIERIEIADQNNSNIKKPAVRYTVYNPTENEFYAFIGTHTINTKLRPQDKGHYVSVRYEGDDPSVQRNGNPMKLFKVLVSEKPFVKAPAARGEKTADGSFITDDDIPF